MKKNTNYRFVFALALSLLMSACHKVPQTPIPEQELITTLQLTLSDTSAPADRHTFIFRDIDGDGGENPTIDSVLLPSGKVYHASLLLLDERNYPPDTSTNEIRELSTEHQFFYQSFPTNMIRNFIYLDFDTNGKPLGNEFYFSVSDTAQQGNLQITLRHQPDKSGSNVSNNDITNAGGETDIQVVFPTRLY